MLMTKRLLTTQETLEYLGISRSYLYKLLEEKELHAVRMGSHLKFDKEDLDTLISKRKDGNNEK